ncbi:MAG: hypothetical protein WBG89_03680 [Ornithinimicrobium sp.]
MSIPPEGVPAGDDDADPTGMRDVLSSLPEPGPMPEELADRICASLEREQGMRDQAAWGATAPVHDLSRGRVHRRPQQWILAAAAVVAVGIIGTVVFDDVLGSGSSGDSPAAAVSSPESEDSNAAQEESADGGASEGGEAEASAAGDGADSVAETGVQSIDDQAFAVGAQSVLEVASGQSAQDESGTALRLSMDLGDVKALDEDELESCITAAGMGPTERAWVGAPTAMNGEEVVILGSMGSDEPHEAWALDRTCRQDSEAGVLKGPVSLP